MKTFDDIYASLRKKNKGNYLLLFGCTFFSVLLISAYLTMMRSPMVLNVLPIGGDSRKQVMMIFALAAIGCIVFVLYAASIFLRQKSQEIGVFMALGASKSQIKSKIRKEFALFSLASCGMGILLGIPLAMGIWQMFKLFLVDTDEMSLVLSSQSLLGALGFSLLLIFILFLVLSRFMKKTNIIDIVNESKKSEPIKDIPKCFGLGGILIFLVFAYLGYSVPGFFINKLHYYPPEGVSIIFYLPALIGLYMILLHTVVNGWSRGKSKYTHIVSRSMLKFEGRQTVNNMLVITLLIAGAYFASFYTPTMLATSELSSKSSTVDYYFKYRSDQDMTNEKEIYELAEEKAVTIKDYLSVPTAILAIDGDEMIEEESKLGTSYHYEYREELKEANVISESNYNKISGKNIDLEAGALMEIIPPEDIVYDEDIREDIILTNMLSREVFVFKKSASTEESSQIYGYKIVDDADYEKITSGLTDKWLQNQVFFNVEDVNSTYDFAKTLYREIVTNSNSQVAIGKYFDQVIEVHDQERGESSWQIASNSNMDYSLLDSTEFRMYWKYMPSFTILDSNDFMKTYAVFLLLFVFIAIICFAAVFVITYTRSLTVAMNNLPVYRDIVFLGANEAYVKSTIKDQLRKIFFIPSFIGTIVILVFYTGILYFNSSSLTQSEIYALILNCLIVGVISTIFYGVYKFTLKKIYEFVLE